MKKILIIRFSSIGDVVLTSPIVRCLKKSGHRVHFLIKENFYSVIENNPYIDKIHIFKDMNSAIHELSKEQFDFIADLQTNYKSRYICWKLKVPNQPFSKLNIQKFLVVLFKYRKLLPNQHIVDRYFEAIKDLHIQCDSNGLDFFINENKLSESVKSYPLPYIAVVAGGSYYTKKIPLSKLKEIAHHLSHKKIILLGDQQDNEDLSSITQYVSNVHNFCGQFNLHESAYFIKNAEYVITSDTGLMHIAAAFKKKIYSLWGNTIPEFGMYPYMPHPQSRILENNHLWCRPCSKLGYQHCPLSHFKCMNDIDVSVIQ